MVVLLILIVLFLILFFVNRNSIPKIIHQTAPGDISRWHPIWAQCQESWKRNFPDYEYKLWTDEDLDEFMESCHPDYYRMYKNYNLNIKRIDAARYFILKEYGGIYADMDFECIRRFDHLLPIDKVSVAESAYEGEKFQNALMISPRGHPFWNKVIDHLVKNQHEPHVFYATGPQVIVNVIHKNPEMVHPLSSDLFSGGSEPYYKNGKKMEPSSDSYSIHHGSCSWCK